MLSILPNERVTYKLEHADEHVLVINKRAGLVTQPGLGHERDSLLNGLFAAYGQQLQNLGKSRDFGLLHRLDRETSGLLVVALTTRAYDALRTAFEERRVKKFYWALCAKGPKDDSGVIKLAIAETNPSPGKPKLARVIRGKTAETGGRTTVGAAAKAATTAFRVLARAGQGEQERREREEEGAGRGGASLVEARPLTGRLHQVRVHLEAIGAPIFGDEFYAPPAVANASPRLALHAHRLVFAHPVTGNQVDVRAAWPRDLKPVLKRLGLGRPDVETLDKED
ncbi:MAG: RluA family pseudouridine synthase [Phycisphaerales bacterium]|nr:RluA family pseudouridine synthase [Phycisphaerales bacterium]